MVSGSENGNVQGGGLGIPVQIPAASKKIVQNLREVVGRSCTDSEIYAVLLECNMEPDDAVQRLLSQDTFHEVKSKRERRKELKETQESRAARCNSGTSNRVARLGNEYTGGRTENELGKAAYKREIASAAPTVSSSSSHVYRAAGKTTNGQPSALRNFFNADDRRQSIGTGDAISSSVQQSPALQSAWPEDTRGRLSMADVVRGKPQNRGPQMPCEILSMPHRAASTNPSHYRVKSAQTLSSPESSVNSDLHSPYPPNQSEMIHGSCMTADRHEFDGEWPVIEDLTAASESSALGASGISDAEVYYNHPFLFSDRAQFSRYSQPNKVPVSESDLDSQNLNYTCNGSASASTVHFFASVGGGAFDDDLLKETSSHESHGDMSKPQEGMGNSSDLPFPNQSVSLNDNIISAVSSAVANLQQLNIGKEPAMCLPEDKSAVVLPNYLQAFASDCSHLSFGTYKSGVASASPMPIASKPMKRDLEASAAVEGSSAVHLNIRNSEYLDHEHRSFMYDTPRSNAEIRNYESLVSSESELRTEDTSEDCRIKNIQQSDPNSSFVKNPNARDLPPPMSEMSLRARESSQFNATQSLPSRYSSAMAFIGPTNSMSEVLNSGTFSLPQLSSQFVPGSNLVNETAVLRLMSEHPYSQPKLPLEELANLIGYRSIPQNHTYVPSALQQAGMNYNLPQCRSGAIRSSLPLSNNATSSYRSFVGNSANIPGSFLHNLSPSPTGTAVGYDDLSHSQFRDGNTFPPFQRNICPSTWDSEIVLQTMSHPESAYFSLFRQNSQHAGYSHAQQASQHYESLGYPNMYHSQMDQTRTSLAKPW